MKQITAIALFTLATLTASTAVQAQHSGLKVDVPFDFTVGEKHLPAGEYRITSPSAGLIELQSGDERNAASIATLRGYNELTGGSKVVFQRYGQMYFLHEILCPTSVAMNVEIPSSNLEKRVRSREAKLDRESQTYLAAR